MILFFLFPHWFPISLVCSTFGGLPYFPENDNQVFRAGYRFGGWVPLFPKNWSSGIGIGYQFGVVSTPLGTRKVELVPGGLVS